MRDVQRRLALAAILASCCIAPAWAPGAAPTEALLELANRCEANQGGLVGLSVVDLRSRQVLAALRDEELFAPASNQKLVTAAFALARIGADFQFTTAVYQLGQDLVVIGNGDPTLGDPFLARQNGTSIYDELDRWAMQVRQRIGQVVAGDLILCTRWDNELYRPPDWPVAQRRQWYQAPVAALNFNNNCLDVSFVRAQAGLEPLVEPASRLITVVNQTRSGRKGLWNAVLSDQDATVTLTGAVAGPTAEPANVAVDDPPMLLGRVLADRLARAGVELKGSVRAAAAPQLNWSGAVELARTQTPLSAALGRALKRSLNMAAESVFLYAGDGTWPGTASLVGPTLASAYGLKSEEVVAVDGSGLSPTNRISPRAMTTLLAGMAQRPDRQIVLSSMAISGVDGTMERRLDEPPYKGRILGKTGYIAGVSCLSGYVLDAAGRPAAAFAVLVNRCRGSAQAKTLQDNLCRRLVDWLDGNQKTESRESESGE